MKCDNCGKAGESDIQQVRLCWSCRSAPQVAAVTQKLAGPIDWRKLAGEPLYDAHGRLVARVINVVISAESIDVTSIGSAHRELIPLAPRIHIEAEGTDK